MARKMVEEDTDWLDGLIHAAITEDNSLPDKCFDIAKGIQGQSADLLKLVEKLGPLLTDKKPELREKGIQILAEVLQKLPEDWLQKSEIHFMTTFFCDRLKDHNVVIPPVLQGILAIIQMHNLPQGAAARIVTSTFQHVHCQSHKQPDRSVIYKVLQACIQKCSEELKLLGPDFVFGVISTIDGERDPRNLLQLFGMLPHFIKTFPLGHLTEEMFDVVSCYFPVDFYSMPNTPNGITRDDLAAALLPCLIASPDFTEFCIPLLLEKLDSQLHVAKLDSLRVLQKCCQTFTVNGMAKFVYDVFHSLHREVVPGTDKEVCGEALASLKELVHMLSTAPSDEDQVEFLRGTLENIISVACKDLRDVQLSLFLPTARMLLTVTRASPAACRQVVTVVVPLLLSQYHKGSSVEGKIVLLQTLTTFLAVCEEQLFTSTTTADLVPICTDIHSVYISAAQHVRPEIRLEGIHGFLISARSLCCEARQQVYELLCTYVKHEDSPQVRQEVTACLKELARLFPDEVMETVVLSKLQWTKVPEAGDATNAQLVPRCMAALCEMAVTEPFTTYVVPQILDFITGKFQADECRAGISSFRILVEAPETGSKLHTYLCMQCGAVSRLVSWWLRGIQEDKHPQIFHSEDLLVDIAKVVSTILRTQPTSVQSEVVAEFIPCFLDSGLSPEDSSFRPLEASSSCHVTQCVMLLEALLSPLRQDVNNAYMSCLVKRLQTLAVCTPHPPTSRSAARFAATLINKAHDDDDLSLLLSDLLATLTDTIDRDDAPVIQATNAVSSFSWLTKALIMRGHRQVDTWIDKLVGMLSHGNLGTTVAEGFKLIMAQNEEYLNSDNYCNVRILYRQRFFQTVPKLVEHYHRAADPVRCNFLIALAYMLQGVPRVILTVSLPELIPLLVESMEQREVVLLLSTLEILQDLMESKQPVLEEHIQTFLPRFLKLTRFPDSLKVRITALRCMLQLCNYPTVILLPYKQQTIHELGFCLDDPKRLVRQQAVSTRSCWFLIGAPAESTQT
jgi:DNA repair/transcription protein MET18/MMS19